MKKIMLLITGLFAVLFTACREDNMENSAPRQEGESLFSFSLPEPVAATRAELGEAGPAPIENLHILVFTDEGFFLADATATVSGQSTTGGQCTAKLPISNRKCRLHFVANYNGPRPDYSITDTESSVVGRMTTTNNEAAYWGIVAVDNIPNTGLTLTEPVELVRNFSKITLAPYAGSGNFTIESYTVYNRAPEGLLAPYDPNDGTFADFTSLPDADPYGEFVKKYPDYRATTKGDVEPNVLDSEDKWKQTSESFYVYERNQDNSDIPTALVIKASYNNRTCYYKLDIVQFMEENYQTITYNLYRNFEYKIQINEVRGEGYATAEEAVNAAASNNLAASVLVSKVKKITDGEHTLEVSTIDTLIVRQEELVLKYKYMEGDKDCTNTDEVKISYTPLNEKIFSSVEVDKSKGEIRLTPKDLPGVMETQEIVIGTRSGLTRRIVVRVHEPYEFVSVDCQKVVEANQKAEFVLMTELPMGLPTAIFPLILRIDMTNNTLYPDAEKNRFPVDVVDAKNYVYQMEVDYNSYRQNRTMYCYFKTNTSQSATTVTVEGTYFKESKSVSFENGTPRTFQNVSFAGTSYINGSEKYTVPFGKGQGVELAFTMNTSDKVVVYTRYLTTPASNTGSWTEKINSQGAVCGYEYQPYQSGRQIIRFQTREYMAGGRIELYSERYKPVIINYTNPWVNVRFNTPNGVVPDGRIVKVYEDAYYQNFAADLTPVSGGNGGTVMKSFVGNTRETILYFLYQEGGRSYRGEMAVGDLIDQGAGDGKSATVELRQR